MVPPVVVARTVQWWVVVSGCSLDVWRTTEEVRSMLVEVDVADEMHEQHHEEEHQHEEEHRRGIFVVVVVVVVDNRMEYHVEEHYHVAVVTGGT